MKRHAPIAALFFGATTILMAWPLARDLPHLVSDTGDPYLNSWILHWDWRTLWHHPAALFNGNIFYPAKLTLAFSENLIGPAILGSPLFWAGATALTVHNFLFLLGMAISGFGAWALARELTGDSLASLAAGLLYAFAPYRFDNIAHVQMQWGGFIPLCLLFLWRFLRSARRRDLVLFTFFFVWNGLTCIYYEVFAGLAIAAILVLEHLRSDRWTYRTMLRRLAPSILASSLCLLPFYAPYALAARRYHFRRSISESLFYSPLPQAFLSAGGRNHLYGRLTARFAAPESQLFLGVTIPLLALAGLMFLLGRSPSPSRTSLRAKAPRGLDAMIAVLAALRIVVGATGGFSLGKLFSLHEPYRLSMLIFILVVVRLAIAFPRFSRFSNLRDFLRRTRLGREGVWAATLVILGIALAFGPRLFLYRELYEVAPFLLGSIRASGREIVIAHLGLGILAAYGLSRIRLTPPLFRKAVITGVLTAITLEFRVAPLELQRPAADPRQDAAWLAARSFEGGVLELPMKLWDNCEYIYRVTEHNHPIVNGYSGFFPPDFLVVQSAFADNPSVDRLGPILRKMGVRVVTFHLERTTGKERAQIPDFLKKGLATGLLSPSALIEGPSEKTLVFELLAASNRAPRAFPEADASTRARIDTLLAEPGLPEDAPTGYLDLPEEGHVFTSPGVTGLGWASCEAGIENVEVRLDGKFVAFAPYGGPRPDVAKVLPNLPCRENCGFSFQLENVPGGRHSLGIALKARNGRVTVLEPKAVSVKP